MLELLVVLAILGILAGYAIPAYQKMVRSNRLSSQASGVLVALYMTRSEAVRRSTVVTMCAANAALTDCATSANAAAWGNGWIVFVPASSGAPATAVGGTVLQVWQSLAGGNSMGASDTGSGTLAATGSPSGVAYITYSATGFSNTTGYFDLCDLKGTSLIPATGVIVAPGGRPQSSSTDITGTTLTCPVP